MAANSIPSPIPSHDDDDLRTWDDACVLGMRQEATRLAVTPSDFAVADMFSMLHADCYIDEAKLPDNSIVLRVCMKFEMKIRRVIESYLPPARVFKKKRSFTDEQVARILKGFDDGIQEMGADILVSQYIDSFRLMNAKGALIMKQHDDLRDSPPEIHDEEMIGLINQDFPGQLERLYHQIRTGTLGND